MATTLVFVGFQFRGNFIDIFCKNSLKLMTINRLTFESISAYLSSISCAYLNTGILMGTEALPLLRLWSLL